MAERTSGAAAGAPPLAVVEYEQAREIVEAWSRPFFSPDYRTEAAMDIVARAYLALSHQLVEASRALVFYADENNWTQPTSWGGRIHDEDSAAIRDGGKRARAALNTGDGHIRRPPATPPEIQDRPAPKPERKEADG